MKIKYSNYVQEANQKFHAFGIEVEELIDNSEELYELGKRFQNFLSNNMYHYEIEVNIVDDYGDGHIHFEFDVDGTKAEAKKDFMKALKAFKKLNSKEQG